MTIQHPFVPIVSNEKLGKDLHRLRFQSRELASGLGPGNFIHIKVSPGLDPVFRRAMSIYSCDGDTFAILFRVIGKGTRLLSRMRDGDRVDILGPLGNGFDMPTSDETVIMVAGGTGLPPLHFLARRALQTDMHYADRIVFLYGISSKDDIALANVVAKLGIDFEISSDDGSIGHRGFVTDLLRRSLDEADPLKARVYSCGPNPMLREVSKLCAEHRVRCQISLEGNMPCGIGTCLGCAVQSARGKDAFDRICKEGPVFDSDEVVI